MASTSSRLTTAGSTQNGDDALIGGFHRTSPKATSCRTPPRSMVSLVRSPKMEAGGILSGVSAWYAAAKPGAGMAEARSLWW